VIFTRVSGPGAIARDQLIDGATTFVLVADVVCVVFEAIFLLLFSDLVGRA
jgi:hypothetical protein